MEMIYRHSLTGLYLACGSLGALGAWLMSRWGSRLGFIDYPQARSSHCSPIPRGGGIGIVVAFSLASSNSGLAPAVWLPLTGLAILALSGDRFDLSPKLRLMAQLLLIAFIIIMTYDSPFHSPGRIIMLLFWTVYIVGTANFYNFMDGINGIAAITGTIGFALLGAYNYTNDGPTLVCPIALGISCSCLGFLPLNLFKARVFMGDTGSILLGSGFACLVYLASSTFLDFVSMASFLFLFYADTLSTMFVRWIDGERLTQAHRRHLYQLLANEKGIPHWQVSLGFALLQLIVGLSVILARPCGTIKIIMMLWFYFTIFIMTSYSLRYYINRQLIS
jgi:UDP-N-acetylmuramyl pentapeptide phosphotransferase/UDP-N-acetylglucosamine-1-phosphate transferase